MKDINDLHNEIKENVDSPHFFAAAFSFVVKKRKAEQRLDADNFHRICTEEYDELSTLLDKMDMQESCSARNVYRSRRLANLLIDEHGKLDRAFLEKVISLMKESLYFIGPDRHVDSCRQEHILFILEQLFLNKSLVNTLQSINRPTMHHFAESLIIDTLQLHKGVILTNAHARRAALSALFCYLRQALGSCFATAPAIVVHDEHPEHFLLDVKEILDTGQLKRVFGGNEFSVPLAVSSGIGDLNKPFVVSGDLSTASEMLSIQPGFITALEIEGIIDENAPMVEKTAHLKRLLYTVFQDLQPFPSEFVTSAEKIIKNILLKHFSLTEIDIEEYESRPKMMIHGALTMPLGRDGKGIGGKGELCSRFFSAFSEAKGRFKGITNNPLLRAWEYTLASFAETKLEFARWNLYSSLGFRPDEKGGIGSCLFSILKVKVEELNRKVEDLQFEYEQKFQQVRILESRMQRAESEDEMRWLKIDYQVKIQDLNQVTSMRDRVHFNAKKLSQLYDEIINFYIDLFPKFFQEVYDPEMVDLTAGFYNDSPAGFRLLFKYGRTNTSQWTTIRSSQEFIDSLVNFFNAAEHLMDNHDSFKGLDRVLTEITSEVISHVRTNEFLESAFYRMAAAHNTPIVKDPLNHMDKIEKKPWVYTSGGNFQTLVSVYFCREEKPTTVEKWVETPQELLVFLADTLKQKPSELMSAFVNDRKKSFLMHSPTHAFLLKPGSRQFREAWNNEAFTYTWVRDNLIFPMERFNDDIILNPDAMQSLCEEIVKSVPENFKYYFKKSFGELKGSMSPVVWRDYLAYTMEHDKGLQYRGQSIIGMNVVDSALFANLPFFPTYKTKERIEKIFSLLPGVSKTETEQALRLLEVFTPSVLGAPVMGAKQLQNIAKALLCLVMEKTSFNIDFHLEIKKICVKERYAMPWPIFFGDSNWVKDEFAFVVNPGNNKLELWRVDTLALEGEPMNEWKKWLDGTQKKPTWGVFNNPKEYVPKQVKKSILG